MSLKDQPIQGQEVGQKSGWQNGEPRYEQTWTLSVIKEPQKSVRVAFAENLTGAVLREMNRFHFVHGQQRERTASAVTAGEFTITLFLNTAYQIGQNKKQTENTHMKFIHQIRNLEIVSIGN